MITRTKQNWNVGSTVRVGFLSMIVKAAIATPGDGLPDAYILTNTAGTKLYSFVPHHGLSEITTEEAVAMLRSQEMIERAAQQRAAADQIRRESINAVFA